MPPRKRMPTAKGAALSATEEQQRGTQGIAMSGVDKQHLVDDIEPLITKRVTKNVLKTLTTMGVIPDTLATTPLSASGVVLSALALICAISSTLTKQWYTKSGIQGEERCTVSIGILRTCVEFVELNNTSKTRKICYSLSDLEAEAKGELTPEEVAKGMTRTNQPDPPVNMLWMYSCMSLMILAITYIAGTNILLNIRAEKWVAAVTGIAGVVLSWKQGLPKQYTGIVTIVGLILPLIQTTPEVTKKKKLAFAGGVFSLFAAYIFWASYTDLLRVDEAKGGSLGLSFYSAIVGGILGIFAGLKLK